MSGFDSDRKRAAGEVLAEMARANGGTLTPREIVDVARDEDSPLHWFFEWDDSTAAELYRHEQARTLVRSFNIEVRINKTIVTLPKYVRDPSVGASAQGYIETARIRTDEDIRRDVLLQEFERAGTALRRARKLADYFGCTDEVEEMISSVVMLHDRFRLRDSSHHQRPDA